MVLSNFETDLGLQDFSGTIKVSANIWGKGTECVHYNCYTTRAKLHNALNKKMRYSTEKTIEAIQQSSPKVLDMVAYRAKISDSKNLAVGERNACHLGITKN